MDADNHHTSGVEADRPDKNVRRGAASTERYRSIQNASSPNVSNWTPPDRHYGSFSYKTKKKKSPVTKEKPRFLLFCCDILKSSFCYDMKKMPSTIKSRKIAMGEKIFFMTQKKEDMAIPIIQTKIKLPWQFHKLKLPWYF